LNDVGITVFRLVGGEVQGVWQNDICAAYAAEAPSALKPDGFSGKDPSDDGKRLCLCVELGCGLRRVGLGAKLSKGLPERK
jgi:hypothetical protein